jgi:prephenate dehydrogenase/cyclohexadieny/prephenate dehydrogenase
MKNGILIIGCGLIGSSILRSIKDNKISKKIFIYEKASKNIKIIKKLKLPGKIIYDFKSIVPKVDFVIICTPISQYELIFKNISKYLNPKILVTDVGSTKNNKIIKYKKLNWIPSHPISGSEVSGPKFGDKNLFKDKWCILSPFQNTEKKQIKKLSTFWKKIGSKVLIMDKKKHDQIFSVTSHLPHLIAYNLVKTATEIEKKNKFDVIKFSAGGLRDFSRIAASNEIMWRDVFFLNKKNIILSINEFNKNLKNLKKIIQNEDNKKLLKILKGAKKVRKKIILSKQDVNKPDFGR